MKRLFVYILSLVSLIYAPTALGNPTPMELRVMQTRMFLKTPAEVMTAFQSLCYDKEMNPAFVPGYFTLPGMCLGGTLDYKIKVFGKMKIPEGQISEISFTFAPGTTADNESSVLRIRIKEWRMKKRMPQSIQVKDPEIYSRIFDELGQYLFVEAIPWTPDIQN